jgi:hypothetical protein
MEKTVANRALMAARLRWVLVIGLLVANVVFFALGAIAGFVGGDLVHWGNGAGGLGGWASRSTDYFSIVVGLAAGVATFREGRSIRVSFAVGVTGLLIGAGFFFGGHLADPCDNGWWDAATLNGEPMLCWLGGIATRFHLLLHGILGGLSAAVAAFIYRRHNLITWQFPKS